MYIKGSLIRLAVSVFMRLGLPGTPTLANAGTCSDNDRQTIAWPQSCKVVGSTVFAKYATNRAFFQLVQVSEFTPAIKLYWMATGTGCVTIKKELIA